MRFYELDRGRITLDGVDIRTVPRSALRAKIGMVLQDTWLFHGTIRENIAYGVPRQPRKRFTLRPRQLCRSLRALLAGRLRHRSRRRSQQHQRGEKQLITIARAFLADPAC
jgi:ATP-binding cassette subfamily B protein